MIQNKKYVLFDLDGTLTDPKAGICGSVQYALKAFGIEETDLDKLEPFIGPPLKDSFMEFYGLSEEDAVKAIDIYHERFDVTGKFENEVYAGIPALLKDMQAYGYHLAVASSKPEYLVKEILEHFELAQYFEVVIGSEPDGTRVSKEEVIREALNRLFHYGRIRKEQVVMVGDRKFDIAGAKEVGVESVAVRYGYAPDGELAAAEPDYMAGTVAQLRSLFIDEAQLQKKAEEKRLAEQEKQAKPKTLQEARAQAARKSPMTVIWKFLFPFLLFYFAGELFRQLVGYMILFLSDYSEAFFHIMFVAEDSDAEKLALSGNGNAIIQIFALICVYVVLYKLGGGKECLEQAKKAEKKNGPKNWILWGIVAMLLAAGLNMCFSSLGWLSTSSSYQEVASNLYALGIPAGLLLYGIFSPLAEELLFRGIIFTQVKEYMKPFGAALLSASLFGIYHGNLVQFVYSLLLGMVLAYAYHYSGRLAVPVMIHGVINVIVFLASTFGWLSGSGVQLVVGIVCVAAAAIGFKALTFQEEKGNI